MLSYSEIFNIQKTTLPVTKKDFEQLLSKQVFMGYVQCEYNRIIDTIKDICKAETYQVTVSPETLYNDGNNPFHKAEVMIQVEGIRDFSEFIDGVISSQDEIEWTDFITYSETFKDEIRNLKSKVIRNILWNQSNLNRWFEEKHIALLQSDKDALVTDWEKFKEKVLLTTDLYDFINCCDEVELKKSYRVLVKNLMKCLDRYRPELNLHIDRKTKKEPRISVRHPIVNKIFIVSQYAKQCQKDWPKLRFISLDKRSFDSLSLWED